MECMQNLYRMRMYGPQTTGSVKAARVAPFAFSVGAVFALREMRECHMMKHIGLVLAALVFATGLAADGLETFYVEEVGPSSDGTLTYTQDWSGAHLINTYADVHEVFVRGEGKHGSFRGVLELRCVDSGQSKWLTESVDGMRSDQVPLDAVREIRRLYC